jgi:hypothetical protein
MEGFQTVFAVLLEQLSLVSPMLTRFYAGELSEDRARKQDLSLRSYFKHPTRQEVRDLAERGFTFCCREDIEEVTRRLKGFAEAGACNG